MKKHAAATALVLTSLSLIPAATWAGTIETDAKVQSQSKEAVSKQEAKSSELKKLVNADVSKGLEKVRQAVKAVEQGKSKECLALLKEAVGSFEVALAADPKLDMVPVSSLVQAQELYTNPGALARELSYARELLNEGKVQEARSVLLPLRSDISVRTTYLPMRTYPDAIRGAIAKLVDGKADDAKNILSAAMSTLVVTEDVVAPIPLVTARGLIDEASHADKQKKDEVLSMLQTAREQLEVARLMGYLPEDAQQYQEMRERIRKIESEVKGENKAAGMYADLKTALGKWLPW